MRQTTNRLLSPLKGLVAVGALSLAFATSSFAAGKQDFTLHNETGVEIHHLWTSPHDVNSWEEDVLGEDTLPSGQSVHITFSPKEEAAMWDLKIDDKDGTSIVWEDLKLDEITDITLHYADGKATAETKNGE